MNVGGKNWQALSIKPDSSLLLFLSPLMNSGWRPKSRTTFQPSFLKMILAKGRAKNGIDTWGKQSNTHKMQTTKESEQTYKRYFPWLLSIESRFDIIHFSGIYKDSWPSKHTGACVWVTCKFTPFKIYIFIWLCQVLDAICGVFSCSLSVVVTCPGIKPAPVHWKHAVLAIGQSLCGIHTRDWASADFCILKGPRINPSRMLRDNC